MSTKTAAPVLKATPCPVPWCDERGCGHPFDDEALAALGRFSADELATLPEGAGTAYTAHTRICRHVTATIGDTDVAAEVFTAEDGTVGDPVVIVGSIELTSLAQVTELSWAVSEAAALAFPGDGTDCRR